MIVSARHYYHFSPGAKKDNSPSVWRKVDGETADDKTYEGLVSTRLACLCDVFAELVGQRVQRL